MEPVSEYDLLGLIERYQDDINYLNEYGDADDHIVADVLTGVIGDIRNLW